jgi:ubiquinone/menaquinone biosynthesis C-methylase UbiE
MMIRRLKLLKKDQYPKSEKSDPLPFYFWPVLGRLYRERVEICLNSLPAGGRVLEIGYGSGLLFPNLDEMFDEIHGIDLKADAGKTQETFNRLGIKTTIRKGDILNLPYEEHFFDAVLCISILEHLQPGSLPQALSEIRRVLKPTGILVYGVPVDRPLMSLMFRFLGYDIRKHHFSTEKDVAQTAGVYLKKMRTQTLAPFGGCLGVLYEVGVYGKNSLSVKRKTEKIRNDLQARHRELDV